VVKPLLGGAATINEIRVHLRRVSGLLGDTEKDFKEGDRNGRWGNGQGFFMRGRAVRGGRVDSGSVGGIFSWKIS
jgi:hypothetical protein